MANKLLIAHLLERNEPGETFEKFPLHVTLMPWFNLLKPLASERLRRASRILQACQVSLEPVVLGDTDLYGEDHTTKVRLIQNPIQLGVIHGVLLRPFFIHLVDRQFVGTGYNPHMTIENREDPGAGYQFPLDSLSLVQHDGTYRTVIETVSLVN